MPCGLFGKLPSKRDFVSYNMPRPFLDRWEQWLQEAVARSKLALGGRWQDIYLTAPIWRFWLGSEVYGTAATGALMPSVDGVGRYFPLSVCACEDTDVSRLQPPPHTSLDSWHATCEQFLLSMLEDTLTDEPNQLLALLSGPPSVQKQPDALSDPAQRAWVSNGGTLEAAFATLASRNDHSVHAKRSYWWTAGGGAHQPRLVAVDGAADAGLFNLMITGSFGHANPG